MARKLVEKRPQAIRDLADIAVYLAEQTDSGDLAFRFLDAAEASFNQLGEMPAMGASREYRDPKLANVRMWRIAGFDRYLIFYRPAAGGVEIIRVLHARRDIEGLFGGRSWTVSDPRARPWWPCLEALALGRGTCTKPGFRGRV